MTYHSTEYGRNGGKMGDWREFHEISDRERYAARIADRVTTVSAHMERELQWLYDVPKEKIDVIPNGIDPSRYKSDVDSQEVKRRLGMNPSSPMVLFAGRLEYQKGPDILLRSIPEVLDLREDVQFVFLGQGGLRRDLEAEARKLGIASSTSFLGFVPFWEYLEKLNSCDMVCIPSRNEPFGLVLLEAWSASKPVVASRVGGLQENIDSGVNGLLVGPEPSALARSISYLVDNPGIGERMGASGREKAFEFGWDKAVSLLQDTYRKALP